MDRNYTLLDHLKHVEGHDDIYHGHRGHFLEQVLNRIASQSFYPFLNTWPTCAVKQIGYGDKPEDLKFTIKVTKHPWTFDGEFDGSLYETDKQAFCDKLETFAQEMTAKFVEEEASGRAWWTAQKDGKHFSYGALCNMGGKFVHIHARLGNIKFRGGAWNWYIMPAQWRSDWPVTKHEQGVSRTLDEAKAKIEGVWKRAIEVAR